MTGPLLSSKPYDGVKISMQDNHWCSQIGITQACFKGSGVSSHQRRGDA